MKKNKIDLTNLKEKYKKGINITKLLNEGLSKNSTSSIEIAYDLQSGSYVDGALSNGINSEKIRQMSNIINPYLETGSRILDCGTGELTTLTSLINNFNNEDIDVYCFDLSLSRLLYGKEYSEKVIKKDSSLKNLTLFSAELDNIPIVDNSIDVVISNNALEPNHGNESKILSEILRVASKKVILFEPSYENNSIEGKKRMEELGYVRGIPGHVKANGGKLESVLKIKNVKNPLNPTHAYIITPPNAILSNRSKSVLACPITKKPVKLYRDCVYSDESLFAYPVISGIPILRSSHAIVASHYNSVDIDWKK
jgi:ubiquinone/menaquinone biosynthesis C-methylase UbiE/uncharacterized protein YbaR (Trm112 family)